ncbi:hypothetical protein HK405_007200, partial [Cladochytrium tenue]
IYYNLATAYPAQTVYQSVLVHAPVSLFHGWLVFVFWLNLLAIFTSVQDPAHPSFFLSALVFLIMVKLTATASSYVEWRHESGDAAGAGVIAWPAQYHIKHRAATSGEQQPLIPGDQA